MMLISFNSILFRKHLTVLNLCIMAQKMSMTSSHVPCRRLLAVNGEVGKQNDMIVCGNVRSAKQHVIYFGGDVQDYKENMERNNAQYLEWDLETTATLLQSRFTDSVIIVVKPVEMLLNTFSLYNNFLAFDEDGRPQFSENSGAFVHLNKLYSNAMDLMIAKEKDSHQDTCEAETCTVESSKVPIKLVGFSKGCVVLNELMFQLKTNKTNADLRPFMDQVHSVYWLDGGHIGENNAYITDIETLREIRSWNKELYVHVTPYQIKSPMRKWIGQQETIFVNKLQDMHAKIKEYRHYMDQPGSIENHFKVLTKV